MLITFYIGKEAQKIACDKKINMKIYNKAQAYSLNIIYSLY